MIRFGVVGLGHRGRELAKIAVLLPGVEFKAACDIKPTNWYETQWLSNAPFAEMFPKTDFYESYDEMLEKADLDVVIVETGADIHAEFCIKALKKDINVLSDIPNVANLSLLGIEKIGINIPAPRFIINTPYNFHQN